MDWDRLRKRLLNALRFLARIRRLFQRNRNVNCESGFEFEIRSTKALLKSFGLWPHQKYNNIVFALITILFVFVFVPSSKGIFNLFFWDSWKNDGAFQCLSVTFSLMAVGKAIVFKVYEKDVQQIYSWMKNDWQRANYLTEERQTIVLSATSKTEHIIRLRLLFFVFFGSIVGYLYPWYTSYLLEQPVKLYLDVWYSSWLTESPQFEIMMFLQGLAAVYLGIITVATDAYYIGVVRHCSVQLRLLSNITEVQIERDRHAISDESTDQELVNCSCIQCTVERHLELVRYHKLMKQLLGRLLSIDVVLGQFYLIQTIVMIFKGIEHDHVVFYGVFWILGAVILAAAIFYGCIFEELARESVAVGDAAYNSNWYTMRRPAAKSCLIIMTYAQNNPMTLSCCMLYRFNNEFVKNFIHMAYCVLSLCRSLNNRAH